MVDSSGGGLIQDNSEPKSQFNFEKSKMDEWDFVTSTSGRMIGWSDGRMPYVLGHHTTTPLQKLQNYSGHRLFDCLFLLSIWSFNCYLSHRYWLESNNIDKYDLIRV